MSATIIAAVIAAGSTGAVGIAGFIITGISTRYTMWSNRQAVQDERMWVKRSAVYEELIRHAHEVKDNSQYNPESAFAARVAAYASKDVLRAYNAIGTASLRRDMTRTLHGAQVSTAKMLPPGRAADRAAQSVTNHAKALDAQEKKTGAAEDALIALIRGELGSEPTHHRRWAWSRWPWSRRWVRTPGD